MGVSLDQYIARANSPNPSEELEAAISQGASWLRDEIASAGQSWQAGKAKLEQAYEEMGDVAQGSAWSPLARLAIEGTRFDVAFAERIGSAAGSVVQRLADTVAEAYGPEKHRTLGELAVQKGREWLALGSLTKEGTQAAYQAAVGGHLPIVLPDSAKPGEVLGWVAGTVFVAMAARKLPGGKVELATGNAAKAEKAAEGMSEFAKKLLTREGELPEFMKKLGGRDRRQIAETHLEGLRVRLTRESGAAAEKTLGEIQNAQDAMAIHLRKQLFPTFSKNPDGAIAQIRTTMGKAANRLEPSRTPGMKQLDLIGFKSKVNGIRTGLIPTLRDVLKTDLEPEIGAEIRAYITRFEQLAAELGLPRR